MHEKIIGELKTGVALNTVPTDHYGANNAWQQLVVLTHNLLTNFQIETGAATRPNSLKRTTLWVLQSAKSLRFEIFNRAGRLVRPNGRTALRLLKNTVTQKRFQEIARNLEKAA